MTVEDTPKELWGGETRKAVDNFPVSGERVPPSVVHWLGRIKGAAARVNVELGKLDSDIGERIAEAGDAVAHGKPRVKLLSWDDLLAAARAELRNVAP